MKPPNCHTGTWHPEIQYRLKADGRLLEVFVCPDCGTDVETTPLQGDTVTVKQGKKVLVTRSANGEQDEVTPTTEK